MSPPLNACGSIFTDKTRNEKTVTQGVSNSDNRKIREGEKEEKNTLHGSLILLDLLNVTGLNAGKFVDVGEIVYAVTLKERVSRPL